MWAKAEARRAGAKIKAKQLEDEAEAKRWLEKMPGCAEKDGTDAKLKARSRQRIDTQKAAPLHPDCAEARRNFLARFK